MKVGNRIKEARKAQGLTQDELAQKIGVKRSVISKYEADSVSLSLEQLTKIADALDTAITFLIDGHTDLAVALDEETKKNPEKLQQAHETMQAVTSGATSHLNKAVGALLEKAAKGEELTDEEWDELEPTLNAAYIRKLIRDQEEDKP